CHVISCVQSQLIADHHGTDDQCPFYQCNPINATCQCLSMPHISAYQCTLMPHIRAHLSCLSVPPISAAYQFCQSMPVSATYQCPSVPPNSSN
ncbi:unnamed protein product, partial [Staurois parvus]